VGKGGRCVGLTILPPSCADCHETWEPKPPGILRVSAGLCKLCFTLSLTVLVSLLSHFEESYYPLRFDRHVSEDPITAKVHFSYKLIDRIP